MRKVAENRKARFNYTLEEAVEAGVVISGREVKALRFQSGDISNSYCFYRDQGLWIEGFSIPAYKNAPADGHDPKRPKKLLLHKKQMMRLVAALDSKGCAVIPLEVYFNDKGWLKIKLAVGKGKKLFDKRADIKQKEWDRRKQRLFKS